MTSLFSTSQPAVRTDCYLAILARMQAQYPHAHFEIITNTAHSPLGPSSGLLAQIKTGQITEVEYFDRLEHEIFANPAAVHLLNVLADRARHQTVFVVCYEKDARHCHRSLVQKLILRLL